MSDFESLQGKVSAWLEPLSGDTGPCGPDLEYDNDFLAITQAAAGKPESQFGPAEPPDWRSVSDLADSMFERTRDLRVAILWLRAQMHLQGYVALSPGLALLIGLIDAHWENVHPLPDPDDGDPYARVNALTLLRETEGLIGDLRDARLVDDRSIGQVNVRAVEVALGLSPARGGESDIGKGPLSQMLAAAVARQPELRTLALQAVALARQMMSVLNDKLGAGVAPDLRPTYAIISGVVSLMPAEAGEEGSGDEQVGEGGSDAPAAAGAARRGLSGAVTSREEAIRAIDLVCEYLERAEPTNPAPLFLRRARQLVSHNFLQLMKVLAPDSLAEVARVVGVDPDTVESPDGS